MSAYRLATGGHVEATPDAQAPAVPVEKSVFPDFIVCLEDGKELKMLKRHLKSSYNMTPDKYRTKWGLPSDYPMVAPTYASHRSTLAKKIGLGRKPADTPAESPVAQLPARRARGQGLIGSPHSQNQLIRHTIAGCLVTSAARRKIV